MADNVRVGHGRTGPGKDKMSHGRTIADQMVTGLPEGVNVNVFQSNDAPTRVFLAVTNGPEDAAAYLEPRQARELARKLLAEAEHAEAFADSLERGARVSLGLTETPAEANRGRGLAGLLADIYGELDARREAAERVARIDAGELSADVYGSVEA